MHSICEKPRNFLQKYKWPLIKNFIKRSRKYRLRTTYLGIRAQTGRSVDFDSNNLHVLKKNEDV